MRFANVAELAYALAPYAFDPTHARAVADRISAVLSVPPITATSSNPMLGGMINPSSSRGRLSMPPGASDTGGTASPWTGTHSGARRPAAGSKGTTIWLGVALAALLVGTGIFAMVKQDRGPAAAAATETATTEVPPPSTSPAVAPSPPTIQPPPAYAAPAQTETAVPAQPTAPPTVPTLLGASPVAPAPPSTGVKARTEPAPSTRRPAAPSGPKRAQRAVSPPAPVPAPAPAPKYDDGIPATRD